MTDIPKKIRSDKLWQDTYRIVEHTYGKVSDIIDDYPDEEWNTASKLRNSASDSLFFVSMAIGSALPDASIYEWNTARKYLFAMQSMYTFATKQKFIELEPEIIVQLDDILAQVDAKIEDSQQAEVRKNDEELEPWLEKYRLWQKMQE